MVATAAATPAQSLMKNTLHERAEERRTPIFLAFHRIVCYNTAMNSNEWNSITVGEDEKPQVNMEDLRELAADLDPDDFDEPVQEFLDELMKADNTDELKKAATLLLQDEIDFSPELAAMGVEPDVDLITLLIATGADVNAHNPYGLCPLHVAAKYGYTPIVETLLAAGAKVTVLSHNNKFPVDLAATDELKKLLALPDVFEPESSPLPPELQAMMREAVGEDEHTCTCGHDHGCDCDHDHECTCGDDCDCKHDHGDEGHCCCGHH